MPARVSRRDMTIWLSWRARRDLDQIRRYTVETWGRNQWIVYYRSLVRIFEAISNNPVGGRDRSLFAPALRSLTYRRHIVFFARVAAADDEPEILRIVHERRNMPALVYFDELEG